MIIGHLSLAAQPAKVIDTLVVAQLPTIEVRAYRAPLVSIDVCGQGVYQSRVYPTKKTEVLWRRDTVIMERKSRQPLLKSN